MLMKTGRLWREPRSLGWSPYVCSCDGAPFGGDPGQDPFAGTCSRVGVPTAGCSAVCEVDDRVFELLKAEMGEAAPAASVSAAEAATVAVPAAAATSACAAGAASTVVAYLLLSNSCIARMHKDGGLCLIRRKGHSSTVPARLFQGGRQASHPFLMPASGRPRARGLPRRSHTCRRSTLPLCLCRAVRLCHSRVAGSRPLSDRYG